MLMPTYLLSNEFTAFYDILSSLSKTIVRYSRGETIIFPGDDRIYHFYVIEGAASYHLLNKNGNNKIVTFRGKGTIFPLYYDYSSVIMEELMEFRAFSDVTLLRFDHEQIRSLINSDAEFSKAMMNSYCKYATILLYDLNSQIFSNFLLKTANFLYIYLSYMNDPISSPSNGQNYIPLSHENIGNIIGVSRANVTRALNTLKKDGVIELYKNTVRVPSKETLLKYCSDMSIYFAKNPSAPENN